MTRIEENDIAPLTDDAQRFLLRVARSELETKIGGSIAVPPTGFEYLDEIERGLFVTLRSQGQLRGCIGSVAATRGLISSVRQLAVTSATNDPRFPPVTAEDLPDIEIEISVLTPFETISGPEEIEIGKHGLFIRRDLHHGLLLPQVATQYHWAPEAFLEQACVKAGLVKDAWRDDDVEIQRFGGQVFSESEFEI